MGKGFGISVDTSRQSGTLFEDVSVGVIQYYIQCGEGVSASYVSQVTKALDSEVKSFEKTPIDDDLAFLFLDALGIKINLELKVKRYKVLVAYGIRRYGSRSLINFRVSHHEGIRMHSYELAPGVHFWRT